MPEITYNSIKPLLASSEQHGRTLNCTFKCPVTGIMVESRAAIEQGSGRQFTSQAGRMAKNSVMWSVQSSVSRAIYKGLGHNLLGDLGRGVAQTAMSQVRRQSNKTKFSAGEKRDAVVRAFERVAHQFTWDRNNRRWVSTKAIQQSLTELEQQLQDAPITQMYDLGVLARMMAEVMNVDGRIRREERELLAQFVPDKIAPSVDDLLDKPPLSKIELEETTVGPMRESIWMLAWVMALTDEDLSNREEKLLAQFARGLALKSAQTSELKTYAQHFVVDGILDELYARGGMNAKQKQVYLELAADLGMSAEEAERADVRYRKRAGVI